MHMFADLFRCPLQWVVNFVYKKERNEENSVCSNFDNCMLNDVCIVLHHYAPRGLSFWKSAGSVSYVVGIGIILDQLKDASLSVNCFVADASEDYLMELRNRFIDINFIATKGSKFDFYSYIQASKLINTANCKYYCMFNDNVDYQSNIIEFMQSAKLSMTDSRLGMIGVGSNTFLTQSFFKKSFSPHVQTYGFFISKSIFDEFVKEFNWYLTSKDLDFLLKSALCRLLEQGLSKFVLHKNYGLGFIQRNRIIKYRRRLKFLDLKGDWAGVAGDYRNSSPSPFLFSGLNDSLES